MSSWDFRPGRTAYGMALHHLQEVSHFVLLRFEVATRPGRRAHLERDSLDDLETVAADRHVLGRIVRHQPHLPDAQVAQDLAPDAVVADVRRKSELLVGRDGVVALVLQL